MTPGEGIERTVVDAPDGKKPPVYRAVVSPGAETWQVDVPEFGVTTRARRIDQAADEAGKAICFAPTQPEWGFNVSVEMANPYVPDSSRSDVIVVDIDGTLALHNHRGPFDFEKVETDDLNLMVFTAVARFCEDGYRIVLLSGRQSEFRPHTERWLEKHAVPYDELFMRAAADRRSDDLVKMDLFDAHVRDRHNVRLVLDDRDRCVHLWRLLGLECWQVAEGKF